MQITHPITLITLLVCFGITVFFLDRAKKGELPELRKMPIIEAIDEAIGRATEMGRPIMFTPGLTSLEEARSDQTLAGLSILRYVCRKAAIQGCRMIIGCARASIVPIAEDISRMACREVGKPEAAKLQDVEYLSEQQFAYAAAYVGRMHRERAASNIFVGSHKAESLIFAMAGHSAGCYQIGGTAVWSQIAFIVPTCDYSLIAEELMAAGAYLSQEPEQLATINSHDVLRFMGAFILIIGVILTLFGIPIGTILVGG